MPAAAFLYLLVLLDVLVTISGPLNRRGKRLAPLIVMVVMVIAVILPVPMAFMHSPAFRVMIVVWMAPIRSGIWRTIPTSRLPYIPSAIDSPVAVDPLVPF